MNINEIEIGMIVKLSKANCKGFYRVLEKLPTTVYNTSSVYSGNIKVVRIANTNGERITYRAKVMEVANFYVIDVKDIVKNYKEVINNLEKLK